MSKRPMKQKVFGVVLGVLFFTLSFSAEAQQPRRIPIVGMLRVGSPPDPLVENFVKALNDLGYIEGNNIAIEYRWAEGKPDRIPELVTELVRLKVDVILVAGVPSVQAAENATKTIPIIFTGVSADPVGAKFIASLARPGGNLTGMSVVATELAGKRLELLKETIPNASRLAALYDPATDPVQLQEMRKVVQRLGVQMKLHALTGVVSHRSSSACPASSAPCIRT